MNAIEVNDLRKNEYSQLAREGFLECQSEGKNTFLPAMSAILVNTKTGQVRVASHRVQNPRFGVRDSGFEVEIFDYARPASEQVELGRIATCGVAIIRVGQYLLLVHGYLVASLKKLLEVFKDELAREYDAVSEAEFRLIFGLFSDVAAYQKVCSDFSELFLGGTQIKEEQIIEDLVLDAK